MTDNTTPSLSAPRKARGGPIGNRKAVRLNPKVRAAIAHRLANPGVTWKDALAAVGCAERTFYDAKASPYFAEHFRLLGRDKILTDILPHAIERYGDLIRNGNSEYVVADLAKDAMAQAGVRTPTDGASKQPTAGSITIYIGAQPQAVSDATPQDVVVISQRSEDDDRRRE